jgi:hypothetical protein
LLAVLAVAVATAVVAVQEDFVQVSQIRVVAVL